MTGTRHEDAQTVEGTGSVVEMTRVGLRTTTVVTTRLSLMTMTTDCTDHSTKRLGTPVPVHNRPANTGDHIKAVTSRLLPIRGALRKIGDCPINIGSTSLREIEVSSPRVIDSHREIKDRETGLCNLRKIEIGGGRRKTGLVRRIEPEADPDRDRGESRIVLGFLKENADRYDCCVWV